MPSLVEEFREAIREIVPDEDVEVILDLGSRDARESLEFERLYPGARIYAFECQPGSIEACRRATRDSPRIEVVPLAVHEKDAVVEFYPIDPRYNWNVGASSLFRASGRFDAIEEYPQYTLEVEATRLDTWARERSVAGFDLVWMDLQGAELLALRGMGELLGTVRAIHTEVEYDEIYTGQVLFPELDRFLDEAGFSRARRTEVVAGWYGDAIYVRGDRTR